MTPLSPAPPTASRRPRALRTANTRARIIAAAQDRFISHGYRATSLRNIAAAAGVSHPGLLQHFASKDELLAVVVDGLEEGNRRAGELLLAAGSAVAFADVARRNARIPGYLGLYSALVGEASTPAHPAHRLMRERYRRATALTTRLLERDLAAGRTLPAPAPATSALHTLAAWDGLQVMEQYLPGRVQVVAALEVRDRLRGLAHPTSGSARGASAKPAAEATATATATATAERGTAAPVAPAAAPAAAPEPDTGGYAPGRLRRAQIVADAMALFGAEGYGDTSLREIAQKVGVSKSTLMHHYPSKDALLGAVLTERDRLVERRLSPQPHLSATARLLSLATSAADNAVGAPGLIEVYAVLSCEATPTSHPAHAYFAARYQRVLDELRNLLREAQREGALPPHRDPEQEAIWLTALWDGLQYQWLYDRGGVDIATQLRSHFDHLLQA